MVPAAVGLSVSSRDNVPMTSRTTLPVQGAPRAVGFVAPLQFGARAVPIVEVFSAPMTYYVNGSCVRGLHASAVDRVVAPNYTPPVGPGWWDDGDGDLSDDGDDAFTVATSGVTCSYRACVKVHRDVCRAAVRTRFSEGPDGTAVRHDVPRGYDEASTHPECELIWESMIREMNSHEDCNTWTLRPASECYASGKTPIDSMWVYDCKVDATMYKFQLGPNGVPA